MTWVKDVHAYMRLDGYDDGVIGETLHQSLKNVDVLNLTGESCKHQHSPHHHRSGGYVTHGS